MKITYQAAAALLLAIHLTTSASAGVFTSAANQMGAIDNPGTIPIGIPALSVVNAPFTFFSNNPTVNYSYVTDSSTNPTAGFFPDYHFLGSAATTPSVAPIWTFAAKANDYYVYPTTDHPPLPFEALESSLWGSNDGGSTWILGTIAEVYEQGWDSAGIPDDGATRWTFSSPVDMVAVLVGLTQGVVGSPLPPYSYSDGDFEIDAVMQTPEPATATLLLIGAGLAAVARRRRSCRGRSNP